MEEWFQAAYHDDYQKVGSLLNYGFNPDVPNEKEHTALMIASERGYSDIVRLLLLVGANVNYKTKNGETPLMFAEYGGHDEIIRLLSKETLPKGPINGKISGPVSAFYTKDEKIYNFFGDRHRGFSNMCKPCKNFNMGDLSEDNPDGSDNCWDISRLLAKVFTQASEEKKWIDFYLEIPFTKRMKGKPDLEFLEKDAINGYLRKLHYIFHNCLYKMKCSYDTVRFHYVDVRQEWVNLPTIINDIETSLASYKKTDLEFEMYVESQRVAESIKILHDMIDKDQKFRNEYIEDTHKLMKDLYFSDESKGSKLCDLYLTSDNYPKDAYKLFKESIGDSKTLNDILSPPALIVNRRGKTMYRVRAQLEALENEGSKEYADKIVQFFKTKYEKQASRYNERRKEAWKAFKMAYDGYINSKFRTKEDLKLLLKEINTELNSVVVFSQFLMDAYLLARMFRKFPNRVHPEPSKIIVYAGFTHIEAFVEFFEEVLKYPFAQYNSENRAIRCLDVHMEYFL